MKELLEIMETEGLSEEKAFQKLELQNWTKNPIEPDFKMPVVRKDTRVNVVMFNRIKNR